MKPTLFDQVGQADNVAATAKFTVEQLKILQAAANILSTASIPDLQCQLNDICEISPSGHPHASSSAVWDEGSNIQNGEPDIDGADDVYYTLHPPPARVFRNPTQPRQGSNSVKASAQWAPKPVCRRDLTSSSSAVISNTFNDLFHNPTDSRFEDLSPSNNLENTLSQDLTNWDNIISLYKPIPSSESILQPTAPAELLKPSHFLYDSFIYPDAVTEFEPDSSDIYGLFPQSLAPAYACDTAIYGGNFFESYGSMAPQSSSPLQSTGQRSTPSLAQQPTSTALTRKRGREDGDGDEGDTSSSLQKRPRVDNTDIVLNDIKWTRQHKACLRCRIQKIKCRIDLKNRNGPCLSCKQAVTTIFRLPCLRYKISDSMLYRTNICKETTTIFFTRPLAPKSKQELSTTDNKTLLHYIPRVWASDEIRTLELTQDRGTILYLELRKFTPPDEVQDWFDCRKNKLFAIPWCIADHIEAEKAITQFAEMSVPFYMDAILDDSDRVIMDVFHYAYRLSIFPTPNKLLQDTLRLWTMSRFVEGCWRCCGMDNVGAENTRNPHRPADWIPLPSFLEHELASILIKYILPPLAKDILQDLQALVTTNNPGCWHVIFLTTMILMHNYEMGVAFQKRYSLKRQKALRYIDMSFLRGAHSGAKTILAHFHYCCKGEQPFKPGFDWHAPEVKKMAGLDDEQLQFMEKLTKLVHEKSEKFRKINQSHNYEDAYWFTSQIFELDWKPRETLEHSLAM